MVIYHVTCVRKSSLQLQSNMAHSQLFILCSLQFIRMSNGLNGFLRCCVYPVVCFFRPKNPDPPFSNIFKFRSVGTQIRDKHILTWLFCDLKMRIQNIGFGISYNLFTKLVNSYCMKSYCVFHILYSIFIRATSMEIEHNIRDKKYHIKVY